MTRHQYPRDLYAGAVAEAERTEVEPAHPGLAFWLGHLGLSEPQRAHGLEVFPVVLAGPAGGPFVLMHEALGAGAFEVFEHGGGIVNEVAGHNRGTRPVLVLEGEAIVGAKQNRTVVASVLVGPGQTVSIPVGCVQQGRWSPSWGAFKMAASMVEPTLRKGTVKEAATIGHVDQARLWRAVEESLDECRMHSPSLDYCEGVAQRLDDAEEQAQAFESVPGQVGVIALLDGALLGLEIIGHPDSWAALGRRLMPSYVMAAGHAVGKPGPPATAPRSGAPEWLARVARARVTSRPARGLGEPLALEGPGFSGAVLWHEGRPAHLVVFAD